MDEFPRPVRVKKLGALAYAGTMGMHLVAGPAVGFGIGYLLDGWFGTDPWMKAVFFVIGIISGFRLVYEDSRKIMNEEKAARDQGTDPSA